MLPNFDDNFCLNDITTHMCLLMDGLLYFICNTHVCNMFLSGMNEKVSNLDHYSQFPSFLQFAVSGNGNLYEVSCSLYSM